MTEADQRVAFIQAICETPKDDAPRLMFADWLDEHGEPERAEFIRVQCESQRIRLQQDEFMKADISNFDGERAAVNRRQDALRRRERELLLAIRAVPLPFRCLELREHVLCVGLHSAQAVDTQLCFRRGFVAAITLPADAWLRHADALCAVCPLEEVRLVGYEPYRNAAGVWVWTRQGIFYHTDSRESVPDGIFDLLRGEKDLTSWNSIRYYRDPELARADLSRACVAWGRVRAGLPPLEAAQARECH